MVLCGALVLWGEGTWGKHPLWEMGAQGATDVGQASITENGISGHHRRGVTIHYGQNMKKCGILP